VNKYIEFFGSGLNLLTIADRSSIAHLCVEQGALLAYFPCDESCLKHFSRIGKAFVKIIFYRTLNLIYTGRDASLIEQMRQYLISAKLFSDDNQQRNIVYSEVHEFDLCLVMPSCSGPKRAQDKVALSFMKDDFQQCLTAPSGFKVSKDHPFVRVVFFSPLSV
jgi:aconitase A